ncbi:MAG: hypothetical protein MUC59_09230 [Saprospiraceae bacterium]|jgi:hypothetical protein|nr:hypothetical protein [Saprospiraceae bacterium]
MKYLFLVFLYLPFVAKSQKMTDEAIWKLGWRMWASSMDEKLELAEMQFDSLLNLTALPERRFLTIGLEIKSKLNKTDEVLNLLNKQDETMLRQICTKPFLSGLSPCAEYGVEKVENKALQLELITMFVNDQYARGNMMHDLVTTYQIDTTKLLQSGGMYVDEQNRNRLKEIIAEHGFPTRSMVGTDAMRGIFIITQHADGDKEWQKSQLINIENAVKLGDMDGQNYAYLYDRIKMNSGEKQLYGTQVSKVDRANKTVLLADTEDMDNLNKRRWEIGMMPIEIYKELMLKN